MEFSIQEIIILLAPYVLSAITFIGTVAKVVSSFVKLKKEVVNMKEMTEVKIQLNQVLKENCELKETLNETLTKIDHIKRN